MSRWLPAPADNGARIRRAQFVAALDEHFDVDWFSLLDVAPDANDIAQVPACVEWFAQPGFDPRGIRSIVALANPTPRAVVTTRSRAAAERIDAYCATTRPAAIVADEIHTAHYGLGRNLPVMVEELQVGHLVDDASWRGRLSWAKNRRYHRRVLAASAIATAPSALERDHLRVLGPHATIEVVANGVDTDRLRPDPNAQVDPDRLIYCGSPQYDANLDAVVWFGHDVLPAIRSVRPDARLVVTGATEGVVLPTIDGVEFVGRVDDIAPAVRAAACSVAPLRRGGGTRIKILESLALGTPVVATTKGAEGLELRPDEAVVVDSASAMAAAVLDVMVDRARRAELVWRGRVAAERHDWRDSRQRWVELVHDLVRLGS